MLLLHQFYASVLQKDDTLSVSGGEGGRREEEPTLSLMVSRKLSQICVQVAMYCLHLSTPALQLSLCTCGNVLPSSLYTSTIAFTVYMWQCHLSTPVLQLSLCTCGNVWPSSLYTSTIALTVYKQQRTAFISLHQYYSFHCVHVATYCLHLSTPVLQLSLCTCGNVLPSSLYTSTIALTVYMWQRIAFISLHQYYSFHCVHVQRIAFISLHQYYSSHCVHVATYCLHLSTPVLQLSLCTCGNVLPSSLYTSTIAFTGSFSCIRNSQGAMIQ